LNFIQDNFARRPCLIVLNIFYSKHKDLSVYLFTKYKYNYMELIPNPHKVDYQPENDARGKFIIEPLYPGYGITLGNMLRRVILSSIPGAAITSVKINGVNHEFSTVNYAKEDVVDIILNIKQIKLRIADGVEATHDAPMIMKIDKKGEGKVTAGDIEVPSQIEIINKNMIIATLTDKAASFEAEFTVEKGRGYLPVENFKGEKFDIGCIAIDAIFTPINQVVADIERVRVGEMTDWDKLILTVETDGSVTPEEAFDLAVNILCEQLNFLKNRNNSDNIRVDICESEKAKTDETLEDEDMSIDAVDKARKEGKKEKKTLKGINNEQKKKRGRPKKEQN